MNIKEFIQSFFVLNFITIFFRLPLIFILDCILGELNFLPHPVVLIGKLISKSEKILRKIFHCEYQKQSSKIRERISGAILVFLVCSVSFFIPFSIEIIILILTDISNISNLLLILLLILDVFWGYQSIAARCLCDEARNVQKKLSISLEEGQNAVARIVGRDTKVLDEKGLIKACVETVAENTTDGIFSPMFFYFFGGAPLAFLYKAINTMDSMIAYKNERYKYFGTFAARLDDFANFIPARLCAFCMLLSSVIFPKLKTLNGIKIFFRDRYKHASPNSAQTESVVAGLLNIQLAGDAVYEGKVEKKQTLGDKNKEIEKSDIKKSVFVMYASSVLFVILLCAFDIIFLYENARWLFR